MCTGQPVGPQAADLGRSLDRRIVALAVPAFFALVTEPLFLLADSAIVGHLGTPQLAGLGVASVVLRFAVGACACSWPTARPPRSPGRSAQVSGATPSHQGVDGLWLAVLVGVLGTAVGVVLTGPLVAFFGTPADVAAQATTYLRLGWLGLTPMLVVLAATGVLRGLHDTRTPLVVAVAANLANIALNLLLVYGLDLGIAGSAIGTDLAQLAAAASLVAVVVRGARREGAPLRPDLPGVRRSARAGGPLVVRTLSLQVCLVAMTWAAADLGSTAVATHQLALAVWTFLAFALDAVAIAAQAITGTALGAGDRDLTRRATDRIIRIGLVAGTATGVLLALTAPVLGPLFTDDPDVVSLLGRVLLGGRGLPARGRGGLRPRRRAHRRRRRPLPGDRRVGGHRPVRARRAAPHRARGHRAAGLVVVRLRPGLPRGARRRARDPRPRGSLDGRRIGIG